jgi:hypothetical protein
MTARPEQVVREVSEGSAEDDSEDDLLVVTGPPASLRIYLRGWLWIALLVSPTLTLGVGLYLLFR